jgi:esterase/lipase superfamily enzyme
MPHHWIMTNREVRRKRVNAHYEERIIGPTHEPLPTFRVATFTPGAPGERNPDALEFGVEVVPDEFFDSYASVQPDADATSLAASKRMFLDLYQSMRDAPEGKKDALFFIHGFNYSWRDALLHLQRLCEIYVEPDTSPIGRIVYFTWPSWGKLRKYKSDQEIALPSGRLLGRVFAKTVQFYSDFFTPNDRSEDERPAFCGGRIHLAAHSMGNQVLEEFLRAVRPFRFLDLALFGEVLLLNADEDWTALELGRPMFELPEMSERIHVYNHNSDDALRVSEWTKNSEKRLGRHGPRDLTALPPRTKVVDCSDLRGVVGVVPDDDPMLQTAVDVLGGMRRVNARERMFDHWGYLNRPEVVADVHAVLRGESSSTIARRERKSDRLYELRST